jgi:hypothetical protein
MAKRLLSRTPRRGSFGGGIARTKVIGAGASLAPKLTWKVQFMVFAAVVTTSYSMRSWARLRVACLASVTSSTEGAKTSPSERRRARTVACSSRSSWAARPGVWARSSTVRANSTVSSLPPTRRVISKNFAIISATSGAAVRDRVRKAARPRSWVSCRASTSAGLSSMSGRKA